LLILRKTFVGEFRCGEKIERDGPVVSTKHGPKDHPLIKHELAARSFVVRSLHRLGLDVEPIRSAGRPTQAFGWRNLDHGDE
jgi:hypothetical protein